MLKWIEATGKTDEAAVAAALAQLGLERDEVSVEIISRAKSGFLGLRGSPARVKVTYEVPDEPEKAPIPEEGHIKEEKHSAEKAASPQPQYRQDSGRRRAAEVAATPSEPASTPAAPESETTGKEEKIITFLTGLMSHMDISARPAVTRDPEGNYQVVLEGEKLGALIGRRGETLDAIQQLTNYAVNRGQSKRVRIHIDAEKYRSKREESLRRLAHKVAEKVVKYRRNVTLEPMNAYERHVIHAALQDYPEVITYSTGTEPNRRTVVAYSKGEHKY